MTDREVMKMALEALQVATTPLAADRQEVLKAQQALRQALAQPEQPMSPEHLPRYVATNGVKPMEGGGGGGSQPECDWTTDTPVPPFKYFDSPEYKIAQPEQEPVCDKDPYYCGYVRCQLGKVCKNTAPPKREWVGLTDEEIESSGKTDKVMLAQFFTSIESIDAMDDPIAQTMNLVIRQQGFDFARAIEAKLKEKNT